MFMFSRNTNSMRTKRDRWLNRSLMRIQSFRFSKINFSVFEGFLKQIKMFSMIKVIIIWRLKWLLSNNYSIRCPNVVNLKSEIDWNYKKLICVNRNSFGFFWIGSTMSSTPSESLFRMLKRIFTMDRSVVFLSIWQGCTTQISRANIICFYPFKGCIYLGNKLKHKILGLAGQMKRSYFVHAMTSLS